MDSRLAICEECGLPLAACNALAFYRNAVKYYALSRPIDGEAFAKSGAEWEKKYREAERANREE